jgi:Erythromycin esterase
MDVAQFRRASVYRLALSIQPNHSGAKSCRVLWPRPLQSPRFHTSGSRLHGESGSGRRTAGTLQVPCFDHFGEDTQAYGYAASFGLTKDCEDEVVSQLAEMRHRSTELASRNGRVEPDNYMSAEQNACLMRNAERYYRAMFGGRVES